MNVVRSLLLTAWFAFAPSLLGAQGDQLAAGISAYEAHDLAASRVHLLAALHQNPASYEANWHMALVLIDIAKQTPDRIKSPPRDSMYRDAESYARHAIAAKSDGAEGHFALANAIGRASLSMGPKDKVRRAIEVRTEAMRALDLDPHHDGAWHILGRWNAEVERLPSLERFFARNFLGGAALGSASWDEAEKDLRLAIKYAPNRIVHHFDLAEILVSRQKWSDARHELDIVATLPNADVSDTSYKRQARELMPKVMEKLHK